VRERNAAVIWDELDRAGCAPGRAVERVPWHPHGETVTSNRKPKLGEVAQGRDALAAFVMLQLQAVDFRGGKSS
jgi:hypothetical protein